MVTPNVSPSGSNQVTPAQAVEILWSDAVTHIKSTDGEVFVPFNVVEAVIGHEGLMVISKRLAALLNKQVQILADTSIECYRVHPHEFTKGMIPDQLKIGGKPLELGDHQRISKAIHKATTENAVRVPTRSTKIPRPPNSFILYRQANHHAVKDANPNITNNEISRILGARWKNESEEVRQRYIILADDLKKRHSLAHPDYQYTPRRPSERKRRASRLVPTQNNVAENEDENDDENDVVLQSSNVVAVVNEDFMDVLGNNGLLYGPNGVEPLLASYNDFERQQIANDQLSGATFCEMDYTPIPWYEMLTLDNDSQHMLFHQGN
ncbi:hypothetical protein PENANT_c031G11292 [Penicillium antarcticum]|uniref:HMG box domain-containing protein n=1 Tax=Penicillium antarcticum TaxID=416450 RepID=A0A1V6PUU1_9EURO|nr:uncharacterized protein N7508_005584 [Penicillium antarcticum]KAJ5306569.1 hypothetical protein N7508_005584 [Penicillium antarcticum]OQD80809.1 hypothetical protein PENANT_c031G11292 [Penicillium antarcticum]